MLGGYKAQPDVKPPGSNRAAPSNMHKQVLADEVRKLQAEIAQLKASKLSEMDSKAEENQIKSARIEIARLEAQKQEIIAQANTQKAMLAKEASTLRAELVRLGNVVQVEEKRPATAAGRELAEALLKRREFEDNFTRTLRELRKELENTSLKNLSSRDQAPMGVRSLLKLSNERIDKIIDEASQVQVEDRLHIEALRLLIENSKLRKCLNEYAEGLLDTALIKSEPVIDVTENKRASKGLFGFL